MSKIGSAKVFFAGTINAALSYAWAGATNLFGPEGNSFFDLLHESAEAAKSLACANIQRFSDYVNRFTEVVYQRLLSANGGDQLTGPPDFLPEGDQIARVLFVGYFRGAPHRAQSAIFRQAHLLKGVHLTELREAPVDFNVFSGSKLVSDKFAPRLIHAPKTLREAADLVRDYIQSCIDNRDQDKECESIGGHIHIAAVTPHGFDWVVPPL